MNTNILFIIVMISMFLLPVILAIIYDIIENRERKKYKNEIIFRDTAAIELAKTIRIVGNCSHCGAPIFEGDEQCQYCRSVIEKQKSIIYIPEY